jgi:23S rRNA (cytosine1962-C5)-methyltransferase
MSQTATPPREARLRLRVTATAQTLLRGGHPWLYADSVRDQNRDGRLGELAIIYDRNDKFLAIGLFDPDSPIRVRILHAGKPVTLDAAWWRSRLRSAVARRAGLFDDHTTGYRLISGENDGWPGLVIDRYDTTFVVKIYAAAWLTRLKEIVDLIRDELRPQRLVLRLSRNIQDLALTQFRAAEGTFLLGEPVAGPVVFLENGLRFESDVVRGQKTGFFLDQRENRHRIGALGRGQDVLNAFSYSGGFSLYAARGGAVSVTDLDISEHALASARRNFGLNRHLPAVTACRHECIQTNVLEWLGEKPTRQFGIIVLDPPSLARREAEREHAIAVYGKLTADALPWLRPGGILLAASCSAHVSATEFFEIVRAAARRSGRAFTEMETTTHAADHPATYPEAHYLKGIYLRF